MGVIVDIIILAIVAICILVGYKRGLSKSILKIASFLIAIILALILYRPIANVITDKTDLNKNIRNGIIEKFNKDVEEIEKGETPEKIEETKEESNQENKEIKIAITDNIGEKIKDETEEMKKKIIEETATEIANRVVDIGAALVVFIVVRIILLVVFALLDLITKLPILKQVDKTGGIIYGILQGLLITYIILAIIYLLNMISGLSSIGIVKDIDNSLLGKILYNNNLLLKLFLK